MPSLSALLGVGAATLFSVASATKYTPADTYSGSSFFDNFNFVTEEKTNGFVKYVDRTTAQNKGYIRYDGGDAVFGVDYRSTLSSADGGDVGRESVRLEGKKEYNKGLFVLDLKHMPGGICGTWPAFWSLGREPWPVKGEIDIIEGVNLNTNNNFVLHTDTSCKVNGLGQTGTQALYDCALDSSSGSTGCGVTDSRGNSFGKGFNTAQGGYYVTEWQAEGIKIWFFPRGSQPSSLLTDEPDTTTFGTPAASFQGDCDIEKRFLDQRFIFSNTFCGDWGGNVYAQSGCPMYQGLSGMASCKKFVAENPAAFKEAYWRVSSFKTYNKRTVTSSSSVAPSSTPHASSSSVHVSSSSSQVSSSQVSSSQVSSSSVAHSSSVASSSVVSSSVVSSSVASSSVASSSVASSSVVSSSVASSSVHVSSSVQASSSSAVSSSVAHSSSVASSSVQSSSATPAPSVSSSAYPSSTPAASSSRPADVSSSAVSSSAVSSAVSSSVVSSAVSSSIVSSSAVSSSASSASASETPYPDGSSSVYPSASSSYPVSSDASSVYPSETPYDSSSIVSSSETPYPSGVSSSAYPDVSSYPVSASASSSVYSTSAPVYSVYPEGEGYGYGDKSSKTPDASAKSSEYPSASSKVDEYGSYPTASTKVPEYDSYPSASGKSSQYDSYPVASSSAPVYGNGYTASAPSAKPTPVYSDYPELPSFTPLHSTYPAVSSKPTNAYQTTTAYETTYVDVCSTGYTTITTKVTAIQTPAPYPTTDAHYAPPGFEVTTKYCAQGCGAGPKTVTVTVPCSNCQATSVPSKPQESATATTVVTLIKTPVPESQYYATHPGSAAPSSSSPKSPDSEQDKSYSNKPVAPTYGGSDKPTYPTGSAPVSKPVAPTGSAGGDKPTYPSVVGHAGSNATVSYSYGTATGQVSKPSQTGYKVPEFTGAASALQVGGVVAGAVAAFAVLMM